MSKYAAGMKGMRVNVLSIVFYDPFDPDEEAYVAEHYCCGQKREMIAEFYRAMRHWRSESRIVPFYEAADARLYPDMAYAGVRAGIFSMGQLLIRNLLREYRTSLRGALERGQMQ